MRGARRRLGPGLPEIGQRARVEPAAERVMGETLHLLHEPPRIQALDGVHDARVQRPTRVLEQGPVGHFLGEGVLEGVLELGKEMGLVEELGRLELVQARAEPVRIEIGDGLEHGNRDVAADHGGALQEMLGLGRETVDAGGQHRLHRAGHLDGGEGRPRP